jgi:hypothetical protein
MITTAMQVELIQKENIPSALDKAKHYRTLSEPELAESICLDILAVDSGNQDALIVYILTLIDQISNKTNISIIKASVNLLTDDYHKFYYQGLFFERKARFLLQDNMASAFSYDSFGKAMDYYKSAKKLSPAGVDDAILRINSCIRTIQKENLVKRFEEYHNISGES